MGCLLHKSPKFWKSLLIRWLNNFGNFYWILLVECPIVFTTKMLKFDNPFLELLVVKLLIVKLYRTRAIPLTRRFLTGRKYLSRSWRKLKNGCATGIIKLLEQLNVVDSYSDTVFCLFIKINTLARSLIKQIH